MTVARIGSMRSRLTRLDEIYEGYSIYFITFCTHERSACLANSAIHESFRQFCAAAKKRHVLVGRYVIMPDHLHFFVYVDESVDISTWIKSLKNSLSKTLREFGKGAPHWQKGYFDHLVRSEKSYEDKWIYVHQNPVRAGLVSEAGDWLYQGEIEPLPFD